MIEKLLSARNLPGRESKASRAGEDFTFLKNTQRLEYLPALAVLAFRTSSILSNGGTG